MAEVRGEVGFSGKAWIPPERYTARMMTEEEATREVYTMAGERIPIPPISMSRPVHGSALRFKIKAAPSGSASSVVMVTEFGEYDISPWLREMLVHTSVERHTELTLVFINTDVEMEVEPGVVSTDGEMPAELASVLLPEVIPLDLEEDEDDDES